MRPTMCVATVLLSAGIVGADPVEGIYVDVGGCDDHGNRFSTEEFGAPGIFQQDQTVISMSTFTDLSACPDVDNPNVPNRLVIMENQTGRFLEDLFYVGDVAAGGGTTFSNQDGAASQGGDLGGLAFRIDSEGANTPLVFESLTPDGVFEPGEFWHFIVQDYANTFGAEPHEFTSIGYADGSDFGGSSASIVQFVPAPGVASLLAMGGLIVLRRARS